ncbi:MAG TPA: MFS transporter [Caulobacteraceae bacterium]|nr:MFS transporter [Caulobacteraceae bacterium]
MTVATKTEADDGAAAARQAQDPSNKAQTATVFGVIGAVAFCHMLNDMMQSLLPAIYPDIKSDFGLNFGQIGLVTLVFQCTASLLQPVVGLYADKRPTPLALPGGTLFTLAGLTVLAFAHSYPILLTGAGLLGMGSSVFHPESSRVARMAAGSRHGLAQAVFQVGGNAGQALGPLMAALVVVRWGQSSLAAFALLALLSCATLWNVGQWYKTHGLERLAAAKRAKAAGPPIPPRTAVFGIAVLMLLIISKYLYLSSITSYFTFYLIERFHLSVQAAQLHLFAFMAAVAVGTVAGGPIGDRFGRKYVIWFSILGVLPFTLLLPYVPLIWTWPLTVIIGLILASAFPAMVVFAQELAPGHVGLVSGLAFGFSFGVGGLGAAALGMVADGHGVAYVYRLCAFLPALGLAAALLPNIERKKG